VSANTVVWVLIFAIPNSYRKFIATMGTRIERPEIVGYGLLLATVQWFVLRGRVRSAPVWIIGTCTAWVIGTWDLVVMIDKPQQFLALCWWDRRRHNRGNYTVLEHEGLRQGRSLDTATVLGSLAGWSIGVRVGFYTYFRWGFQQDLQNENLPAQVEGWVLGIVSASISAPVLTWILRHPKPEPVKA